jgi:hypothetical protein
LSYYEHLFRRYRLIERSIDLDSYDCIILRYPLADKTGIAFTSRYQVITEHHSNERSEVASRMAMASSILEKRVRKLILSQEQRYAVPILSNCRGIIAVTDEIRAVEQALAGAAVPAITIANGIDVQSVPHTGFARFDGRKLDILFVGTSFRPWHGLDRIIASLNQYRGSVHITLHVVGNITSQDVSEFLPCPADIRFHGTRFGSDLDTLMSNMNLAISTMGLYRKNMEEASSLKTRDYTARGLPFVLAYQDPDLEETSEEVRFYLRFENNDSLLDFSRIMAFAEEVSRRNEATSLYMREYASAHMDWQVKLSSYVDFVKQIDGTQQKRPLEG